MSTRYRLRPALTGALALALALPLSTTSSATATAPATATAAVPAAAPADQPRTASTDDAPLVFGHRGASGYRPEHTLASYQLAIALGADYVEPDLVSTSDGVLVARHENEISGTTDVADRPEFADRRTTKTIDGRPVSGWFTEDFTLAELKTLRAIERLPDVRPDNTRYDGRFEVPTFQEVIDLVEQESERLGRDIGIAPETKHPTYFDSIDLSLEEPLLRTLRRNGLDRRTSLVYVQSFEVANIRWFSRRSRVGIVQLTSASGAPYDFVESGDPRTYADLVAPRGLRFVSRYADVLGPEKNVVIPRDAAGYLTEPSDVVDDAHDVGLDVVVYTVRDENQFLPADFRVGGDPNAKGDVFGEIEAFLDAGVDGFFTDFPDTGVDGVEWWLAEQQEHRRPAA